MYDGAGQSLQATRSIERPEPPLRRADQRRRRRRRLGRHQLLPRAPAGQFGDSGVGILHGPGYWNVDLGFSKNFYIDDRRYLTFRIEAFNVLNHPNSRSPRSSADIADPTTFGRIPDTFSPPRIVELVVKFTYER